MSFQKEVKKIFKPIKKIFKTKATLEEKKILVDRSMKDFKELMSKISPQEKKDNEKVIYECEERLKFLHEELSRLVRFEKKMKGVNK